MSEHSISITVNGTQHKLTVEPRTLLVSALRDELGYTGTNVGCETGRCGACTVRENGETIKSCTRFAIQSDGSEIETVEGLASDGDLTALQESFQKHHGLQCGYCTPGILMSADTFLQENDDPTREEIREAIEGNLCRCTGYQNIIDAIEAMANQSGEQR